MSKFLEMLLEPSTMRGIIIAVSTLAGFVIPEAKIESIMVMGGVALAAHEIFRKQYDTDKLNKGE